MERDKQFTYLIGKKIRRLREERDLTLTALAKRAGISKSYLSHIETGKVGNVSLNMLRKVASALKIDLFELLGNLEAPEEDNFGVYEFPFNKEEFERILAESDINEGMVDEKAKETLITLGKILADPDFPIKYLDEVEDKLSSYARWLSDRLKEKAQKKKEKDGG